MRNGSYIIDSDGHTLEPPGLWEKYIDPAFRGRVQTGGGTMFVGEGGFTIVDGQPTRRRPQWEWVGDRESALAHARAMCAVAEAEDVPYLRAQAYIALGLAHELREEWPSTVEAMELALSLAREQGIALQFEALMLAALARAQANLGAQATARATVEQAVEAARRHGTGRWEYVAHLAVAHAALGAREIPDRDVVDRALAQAMQAVRVTGALSHEPFVLLAQAQLALRFGDVAASTEALARARSRLSALGARPHLERLGRDQGG